MRLKRILGQNKSAITVALLVGCVGVTTLMLSHAATPAVSVESENGTVISPASSLTDTTASGGQAVKFGVASAKPTAANTGVPSGTSLTTITGDYTVDRGWNNDPSNDGRTIQNLHVTGDLYLAANNLTVKNVQVDGSIVLNGRPGGNYYLTPVTGINIDHCSATYINVGYGFDNYSLNHCHIGSNTDTFMAFWPSASGIGHNLTIQNSLFDNLLASPDTGKHLEAIHGFGGTYVSLVNNVIDFRPPDQATWNQITAAMNLSVERAPANDHYTLDGNWFYGGSYNQIYFISSNATVTNNKFTSYVSPDGGHTTILQYAPSTYCYSTSAYCDPSSPGSTYYGSTYPKFTQSGNTLDGSPVSLPGGN